MAANPPVRRTRSYGAGLLAGILGAVGLLAGPAVLPAEACSCIAQTEEDAFARADAVFRGQVTGFQPPPAQPFTSSTDPAIWTFAVSEVFKGVVAPSQRIVSTFSGASCGLEIAREGEFFVFATRLGLNGQVDGDDYHANLCGGTRSTGAGPLDVVSARPSTTVTTQAPITTNAPTVTTVAVTQPPPSTKAPATTVGVPAGNTATTQRPEVTLVAAGAESSDSSDGGPVGLAIVAAIGVLAGLMAVGVHRRWARSAAK